MSTEAWLFLVSRSRYFDYRTIVSPDFIAEAKLSGWLSEVADGDITGENSAIYCEIYHVKVGKFALVFRIIEATGKDIELEIQDSLKDPYGRNILLIEGLVFKELVPDLKITLKDFDQVHNQIRKYYQLFWKVTHSPKVIQSTPFSWNIDGNSDPPMQLTVKKSVSYKPHTDELVVDRNCKWIYKGKISIRRKIVAIAFHPNSDILAWRDKSQLVEIWQFSQSKTLAFLDDSFLRFYETLSSLSFSTDGTLIATGCIEIPDQNTVKIWNWSTQDPFSFHGHQASEPGRVYSVAFSAADNQVIASAGRDKVVRIWDIPTQSQLSKLVKHSAPIKSISISPNGKTLISGDNKGIVNIWRVKSGKHLQTIEAHDLPINSVIYSPSNNLFATSSDDCTIKLWDANTGQHLCTLSGHEAPVNSLSFGIDGKTLATGSDDCTVRIWNLDNLNKPLILREHEDAVLSVAFSPNGQLLASGSMDGTVRIWKQETC